MHKYVIALTCSFFLVSFVGFSQSSSISQAYEQDITIRKTGMAILGTWAVSNMITGAIGRRQSAGSRAYLHEMNLIWNVVNIGIAGAAYYFASTGEIPQTASSLLSDQISFQKILLFNAGLDLAYVLGGFYLLERAKSANANSDRLRGYGKSIVLQGSFLFLFDIILHTIHSHKGSQIADFLSHLKVDAGQVSLIFTL